jgi:predicted DNA-binding transcriptional regulator AlpA
MALSTSLSTAPRRALRTTDAARYLGVSPSLLRKMRTRGADDPLGVGPTYIRLSSSLIVYEIAELDAWLESRAAAGSLFRGTRTGKVRDGGSLIESNRSSERERV